MRIIATVVFLLAVFANSGYCLDVFKTETVFYEHFENDSMPTDIVFENKGGFTLYDGMKGDIRSYKNNKLSGVFSDKNFIGGNCLVALDGDYYLCDSVRKRVIILNSGFKQQGEIKSKDFDPTDLVQFKNRLFIADNDNHRLAVYDKSKKTMDFFGKRGSELGSFNYPFSVAIDKDGYMFVSEVINTRVQMVTPALRGTFAIGRWGVKSSEMYRPKGVAVYNNKYLIVSDGYIGVLQIFDMKGRLVGVVGDSLGNIKRYQSPTRVRISDGRLAVVDPYSRVVEILDLGGLK